jgi:3-hydroxymyristoyl/3-hydroxydecanoyl-(acyl carrier protein) dehydratase
MRARELTSVRVTEAFESELTTGEGDERHVRLRVPARSRFFEGHFEGRPMLPGVAQVVAIAQREAERTFGALGTPRRMSRLKFQDVIVPGDALALTLTREVGEGTLVRFRIERLLPEGARIASSGTITYGE